MTEYQITKIEQHLHNKLEQEYAATVAHLSGFHIGGESFGGLDLSLQFTFNQQMAAKLRRVEQALERVRQGLYGRCERCGTPIWERLEVLPYAELCIDCQRKTERNLYPRPYS